ncbi:MAG TPA: hypothetical protein PLU38_11485 [Kiritimatiellia bacterium]|jgi:hypothetical protein|nr:MAG: hypothetical protein BWX70_00391 [Verrucomicrobia bacterium ADurb.Bin070]HPB09913.1 hypothetical protein [Kiritimatiellia bacterium]HPO36823.1 hypothetical protein [Kiritimatiellia bacterium]HQA37303.1 hypothetical protein [Kiritimatiellia bacterium]HQL51136.1 hypothetical protein [Kiritimatiellia bacterium]
MSDGLFALKKLTPPIRLMLGATGAALAVALAVAYFGIWPAYQRLKSLRAETAQLGDIYSRMQKDIASIPQQTVQTEAAEAECHAWVRDGVIEPLLGSYAMRGKSLLDPLANASGFAVGSVKEDRFIPLQLPTPPPQQLYGRQLIECSGFGSYTQIVGFVQAAEQKFPFAILSGLRIESQSQTPERHKATITFEWPVKGEKRK